MRDLPIFVLALVIAWWPHRVRDTSNEWNKDGAVLLSKGDLEGAEHSFVQAKIRNPLNADTYLNLAIVHEKRGDLSAAANARREAEPLLRAREEELQGFKGSLSGTPP